MNSHSIKVTYSNRGPATLEFKSVPAFLKLFKGESLINKKEVKLPRVKMTMDHSFGNKTLNIRVIENHINKEAAKVESILIPYFLLENGIVLSAPFPDSEKINIIEEETTDPTSSKRKSNRKESNLNNSHKQEIQNALFLAAEKGNQKLFNKFLEAGAKIEATDSKGQTSLIHACLGGNIDLVQQILNCKKINVNTTDKNGQSALHASTSKNYFEITKLLINGGANVNAKTNEGSTPAFFSAQQGSYEILELLINSGADIAIPSNKGTTPFIISAKSRSLKAVELLFSHLKKQENFDINQKGEHGLTALHGSAIGGSVDIFNFLIQNGASKEIKNIQGRSLLFIACVNGNLNIVKEILNSASNKEALIYEKDHQGCTPLIAAIVKNRNEIVSYMLEQSTY